MNLLGFFLTSLGTLSNKKSSIDTILAQVGAHPLFYCIESYIVYKRINFGEKVMAYTEEKKVIKTKKVSIPVKFSTTKGQYKVVILANEEDYVAAYYISEEIDLKEALLNFINNKSKEFIWNMGDPIWGPFENDLVIKKYKKHNKFSLKSSVSDKYFLNKKELKELFNL